MLTTVQVLVSSKETQLDAKQTKTKTLLDGKARRAIERLSAVPMPESDTEYR